MSIENRIDEDGEHEAILTGILADQAALSGILNTLYELHRPILRVELLRDPREAGARVGTSASDVGP